jgi:hypothetical protein
MEVISDGETGRRGEAGRGEKDLFDIGHLTSDIGHLVLGNDVLTTTY